MIIWAYLFLLPEGTSDHGTRKNSPPEAEEQGLPGPTRQEAAEELGDGQAPGWERGAHEHLRECGPGLAEVDSQGSQPQHVRCTKAGALNRKGKWSCWWGAEPTSQLQGAGPYLVTQQLAQPGEYSGKERASTRGRHKTGGPGALPTETVASPGVVPPTESGGLSPGLRENQAVPPTAGSPVATLNSCHVPAA